MRTAIIGLERSGKTSVFNALTGQRKAVNTFGRLDAHIAVIKVPDERMSLLQEVYSPPKVRFAEIEFLDIPGSINDSSDPKILACAREADALCMVLRDFQTGHPDTSQNEPDPERDHLEIVTGLILADMAICENRITSLKKKRAKASFSDIEQRELKALEKVYHTLESSLPASKADLTAEEEKLLRSFQLLSLKRYLTLVNISERSAGAVNPPGGSGDTGGPLRMCAKLEAELQELADEERHEFMQSLGIKDLSVKDFIRNAYATLGLISFFTAGEKEVCTWTIRNGKTALDAAGKIHSDLARGFIQAEVFNWKDLAEHGTEKELRRQGLLRTEGKDYVVQDGDVINVKFNV